MLTFSVIRQQHPLPDQNERQVRGQVLREAAQEVPEGQADRSASSFRKVILVKTKDNNFF